MDTKEEDERVKDPILVIFMRTDLNMSRGKIAVQAGHAVALTMVNTPVDVVEQWMLNNQVKIVLAVNTMKELRQLAVTATSNKIPFVFVKDAGRTEVDPGATTCLVLGISPRNRLQKIISGWKALK